MLEWRSGCLFKEAGEAFCKGGLICQDGKAGFGLGVEIWTQLGAHLLSKGRDEVWAHFRVMLAGPDLTSNEKAGVEPGAGRPFLGLLRQFADIFAM